MSEFEVVNNKAVYKELGYTSEEYGQMTYNDLVGMMDSNAIDIKSIRDSFKNDLLEKGYWDREIRIKEQGNQN